MSEIIYVQDNGKKRKATAEEIAQFEKDQAEYAEQARLIEAEQTAKAEARESAMAKLKKLGLTDDEIAALVP
jgi:predicted negative regulator of RcsB-dependent stress response